MRGWGSLTGGLLANLPIFEGEQTLSDKGYLEVLPGVPLYGLLNHGEVFVR